MDPPPTPDPRLANLLAVVALGLSDRLHELGAEVAGIDALAATALVALLDFAPGGSVRQLSQVVGLTHSGAVRLADRLVRVGLLRRRPGRDERTRALELTRRGRSVALALRAQRQSAAAALLEGLSRPQLAQLARCSEVMVANLTRYRLVQRTAGTAPAGGALCRWCDFVACGRPVGDCPAAIAASATSSLLRGTELGATYEAAFVEWDEGGDPGDWDATVSDGVPHDAAG